jgi:alkylated DNA repair protein (DNA oxidative demethylase)
VPSAIASSPRQLAFDQMREGPQEGVGSPEGLLYRPDFVTQDEEKKLVEFVEALDFQEVRMRGQTARRTVRHFGYDYGYDSWKLAQGEPIPSELEWLRDRCASIASLPPERLVQALVSRYPPGAGIGWHRDAPKFGPQVFGVSLLSGCRMRLQRRTGGERHVFALELAPRSAYVLAGEARSAWQHSIPPMKALRYSITFRTLKS